LEDLNIDLILTSTFSYKELLTTLNVSEIARRWYRRQNLHGSINYFYHLRLLLYSIVHLLLN